MKTADKSRSGKNAVPQLPQAEKRWHFWAAIAALIIVPFILYWPSIRAPFIFDDIGYITENTTIKQDFTRFLLNRTVNDDLYNLVASRPVTFLTLRINYLHGGLNVFEYHLANVILHIFCTLLIFFLSRRILSILNLNRRLLISTGIGFIFVIHPINSEVVAYTSHRSESLATFFYLAVLLCFTYESGVLFALGTLLFVLGLLSKEIVATVPLMLLLLDYFILSDRDTSNIAKHRFQHGIFWMILLAFLAVRYFVLGQIGDIAQVTHQVWTPLSYFATQIGVILKYIELLFLPLRLCLDHWILPVNSIYDLRVVTPFIILCILLFISMVLLQRHATLYRIGLFSILWFTVTLSPTSSFLPINDAMAERRLYLPQFGFWLLIACFLGNVFTKHGLKTIKIIFTAGLLAYCSCLIILTLRRSIKYQDPMTLWSEASRRYPKNYRAHDNVGSIHYQRSNYPEAIKAFRMAIEADPRYSGPRFNLGTVYFDLGDFQTAQKYYEEEIRLHPTMSAAINNLGLLNFKQGNLNKAEQFYHRAIDVNPRNADAYGNLGNLYASKGLANQAIDYYSDAVRLNPDLSIKIQAIIQNISEKMN